MGFGKSSLFFAAARRKGRWSGFFRRFKNRGIRAMRPDFAAGTGGCFFSKKWILTYS
jgi:hypothetical protein